MNHRFLFLAGAASFAVAACGLDPTPPIGSGDDLHHGTGGTGGGTTAVTSATATSTTTTATTSANTTGTGGQGGDGGQGGMPHPGCGECTPDEICVDDLYCASACPDGRDACRPTTDASLPGICCPAEEQCCESAAYGYTAGDLCRPKDEACPLACAGTGATCPINQYCGFDNDTASATCTEACPDGDICGFNSCCGLGTVCVEGGCPLGDLTIDAARLEQSLYLDFESFSSNDCEVVEKCITETGTRKLMRFDLATPNVGKGDVFLGDPTGNPLFKWSGCHGHYHFSSYATYRLLSPEGVEVATGFKQAFCLLDWDPLEGQGAPKYDCGFQGIQAGWEDVYEAELPCQWIDVTEIPAGDYILEATVNGQRVLAESDYENNTVTVDVRLP